MTGRRVWACRRATRRAISSCRFSGVSHTSKSQATRVGHFRPGYGLGRVASRMAGLGLLVLPHGLLAVGPVPAPSASGDIAGARAGAIPEAILLLTEVAFYHLTVFAFVALPLGTGHVLLIAARVVHSPGVVGVVVGGARW